MKKIHPFPVPLKSRSLEYLTSDRKKLRRSNRTGPKLVQNSSRGKWKGRKTPPSPPSSAFRFVRVPRCNIEMIYIFVGCQWPPKSCTVRLPYYHFLFFFLCSSVIITIPSAYAGWKWRETESMQTEKSQSLDFHGSRGNSERGNDATMVEERWTDRYDRGNEGLVI